MSRPSDESRWQEDYQRERRFGRMSQEIHAAICRSKERNEADARAAITRALDEWDAEDEIAAHLTRARRNYLDGDECRFHLRQAAQLLAPYVDLSIEFETGGAFA